LKLAFELVTTGRLLGGSEMRSLNLAARLAPPSEVLDAALDVAVKWSATPVEAMQEAKSLLYRVSELAFDEAMAAGRDANIRMRGFVRPAEKS
jgi:enoyl-CoA hydratase